MKNSTRDLDIVVEKISNLKPCPRNARTHSKKQIKQIAASMAEFGFTNPVLINEEKKIIAGHGRVAAAKKLGLKSVPTIKLDHLTKEQIRAYMIADNKLADNAGWDNEILAIEFQALYELDLDFDLSLTGFELPEIDFLIQETKKEETCEETQGVFEGPDRSLPAISEAGDLWKLGAHRLFCGDALVSETYKTLMGDDKARMIFTDPPYNVPIAGNVSGLGKVKHDDFEMACGELSEEQFIAFHKSYMQNLRDFSAHGSLHFICMDWRHIYELLCSGRDIYEEFKHLCVWNKSNGGMGSFYRSKYELVFVFKRDAEKHINNIHLGKFGRNRTNVWDYAGATSIGKGREADLAMHPTVKPVAMIADAILDVTNRGDIVLDIFAGSGSTLLAAEKTGRVARCVELDPYYVDVIIERFQSLTGSDAVRLFDGKNYNTIKHETLQIFGPEPSAKLNLNVGNTDKELS